MKANQYQCAMCKGVFDKGWSDEEANQELIDNFGKDIAENEPLDIVCDPCYQKIKPSDNPDIQEYIDECNKIIANLKKSKNN